MVIVKVSMKLGQKLKLGDNKMRKVRKNQTYQTRAEVEAAAEESSAAAIASSVRHWDELATAPVSDLRNGDTGVLSGECALCRRNCTSNCNSCPLYKKLGNKACYADNDALYNRTRRALKNLCRSYCPQKEIDAAAKRFRRVAEKMRKLLSKCEPGD